MTQLKNATLRDVCTLVTDGTHDTPKTLDSGVPFIKAKQINDGIIEFSDCEFISHKDHLKVISRSKPEKGDTLFAHIGASLGEAAYINTDLEFSIKNVALFKPDPQRINSRYLYYLVINNEFQDGIKNRRTGSAQPFVSLDILRTNPIRFIEDIPTQRRIAEMLSAYDDLIENNKRRIRILEQMAKAIYREWFGKVGKDSLPKGWKLKPFGELLSFDINGGWGEEEESEQFSTPAYVIRGTDIPDGRYGQFYKVPFRYHKESNFQSRQLRLGDIVIEVAGGSKGQPVGRALLVGKKLLQQFEGQVICASFCKLVRPNPELVLPEYLYLHLRDIYENGQIEKYQTQSTGIINFKSSFFLEDNLVIIPDKAKMDKFIETIRPMFEMIETLGSKNTNLRQTRDILLPHLVSGEIELK